MSVADAIDPCL